MNARARHVGLALLATLALAGCASTPEAPEKDWPMVPSAKRAPVPAETPAAAVAATPAPAEDPALQTPPAPEQVTPTVTYADVFERIRAGYGMADVDDRSIDRELDYYVTHAEYLDRTFARAERYLYYVVSELEARGMPLELAMLPVVESAYNPYAYSRARAAGIWQFIPPTAARYQVRVNWWQDGRRDILDSTRAALDYLQVLHGMFGDWMLALAAYNCGEGCVQRAIDRNVAAGLPIDYFSLRLPKETRAYVPKLLALSRVVASPADYGLEFAQIANEPYFARVDVGGQIDLRIAATLAGVTDEEMHALNPAFNRWATDPDGPHHLLVPYEIAPQFSEAVAKLAADVRMPVERHVVAKGETLAAIAKRRQLPASAIQQINGLSYTSLRPGDEVLLPASSVAPLRAGLVIEGERGSRASRGKRGTYVVRRGDTLWAIAKRHRVSVSELARMNGLSTQATLPAGRKLVVYSGGGGSRAKHPAGPGGDGLRRVQYTVRRGDTLHEISRRFQCTVAQLRDWNGLSGADIKAGQKIVVYVDGSRDYGG